MIAYWRVKEVILIFISSYFIYISLCYCVVYSSEMSINYNTRGWCEESYLRKCDEKELNQNIKLRLMLFYRHWGMDEQEEMGIFAVLSRWRFIQAKHYFKLSIHSNWASILAERSFKLSVHSSWAFFRAEPFFHAQHFLQTDQFPQAERFLQLSHPF